MVIEPSIFRFLTSNKGSEISGSLDISKENMDPISLTVQALSLFLAQWPNALLLSLASAA
ncbi:hypothetical protein KT99_03674 [Shewanella benthica KT99]|uniref:Uncharacterized protein n=1 Tax=Shewanella benthica KT99 TaxID=314608 RepID=A9DAM1_9GAMM|nr:hypothetical protein KT99_03674 [Shewanella benthica KT99]